MWRLRIDTGGTFTDCLAIAPDGTRSRVKVLSSSALRATVREVAGDALRFRAPWTVPDGFLAGATLCRLGAAAGRQVIASSADPPSVRLAPGAAPSPSPSPSPGEPFELRFALEAPLLAAHLVTGTTPGAPLPPLRLRLATTRGTNALLERRGAAVAFFVTAGFGDLLRIGDQRRPELFALEIVRPEPLYATVVEVPERLAADGAVLRPLELGALAPEIARVRAAGIEVAAVALLHSYRNPAHEEALAARLAAAGFVHVSTSAALAPAIKILPRAETAVVNAYLAPAIERYLARIDAALAGGALHVMTSAGGLVRGRDYQPKDSLLSGPAGGVVGAAASGRGCGHSRLIAFDMGGTSTDVARYGGDFAYRFEHRVGGARLAAPALEIETVAAGGGSICRARAGGALEVGPESAGADPGPACYGAGGPLTLTDVNLLLGRLDPERFGIPIAPAAAEAALAAVTDTLGRDAPARDRLLLGLLAIADERMADAIRRISVRRGYDPREHALVAFGGAGGQHACAVASRLGIDTVILPADAGLLSAVGLDAAVLERFALRPVLRPLVEVVGELSGIVAALAGEARQAVVGEGVAPDDVVVRRRALDLRLAGQEHSLEVPWPGDGAVDASVDASVDATADFFTAAFAERYAATYGYPPPARPIEVVSARAIASSRPPAAAGARVAAKATPLRAATAAGHRRVHDDRTWRDVAVYRRDDLATGDHFTGPALLFDPHAALWLPPRWHAVVAPSGAVICRR